MSIFGEYYQAQVLVHRSPWDEVNGQGDGHEHVTSENTAYHSQLILAISQVERIVGRKLNLKLMPESTDTAWGNYIEDGYIYDVQVTFVKVIPYDVSSYFTTE